LLTSSGLTYDMRLSAVSRGPVLHVHPLCEPSPAMCRARTPHADLYGHGCLKTGPASQSHEHLPASSPPTFR
jgi:hypothetical protein